MRILLVADVHANWDALYALQRAEPQPDALLFAGDAVGYGPEPAACAQWLARHATIAVCGNHDQALTNGHLDGIPPELEGAADETVSYARNVMAASLAAAVRGWIPADHVLLGGTRFYITHGSSNGAFNPATCPESALESMFRDKPADVYVVGHTHIPAIRRWGDRLVVNPGSLGQPRYGTPDATYAVWADGDVQIRHLHYDHTATANKLRMLPLSPEVQDQLADVLATGLVDS